MDEIVVNLNRTLTRLNRVFTQMRLLKKRLNTSTDLLAKTMKFSVLGPPAPGPVLTDATPVVGLRPIDVAALRVAR